MKVIVLLSSYNGEKYIREQLDSLLAQQLQPYRIIIRDDGSSDGTIKILEEYSTKYKHISYYTGENLKPAKSFWNLIEKTEEADYYALCDQDDVWCVDKVRLFTKAMEATAKDLYFSDGYVVDADLTRRKYSLWDTLDFSVEQLEMHNVFDILLKHCVVTGSAMAVSRQLINSIDVVPDGWLHDGWLAMAAAVRDSIEPIDCKTYLYRQHGSNAVGASSSTLAGRIRAWANNIGEQPRVRTERRNRYKAARNLLERDSPQLDECVSFWETLCSLETASLPSGAKTVAGLFAKGMYDKYYTGARGALRDVLWLASLGSKSASGR